MDEEKAEVKTVRAKFQCASVTKRTNWNAYDKEAHPFVYDYRFQAVTGKSEENKQFFASTPTGTLELGAVRDDLFEPGQEYYLDFLPA